ncbi:MAG: hypothetical protein WBV69_07400 [Candidatus Sulfotelmatobacter sp.]
MRLFALITALFMVWTPWTAAQRASSGGHASAAVRSASPHISSRGGIGAGNVSRGGNYAFGRGPRSSAFRRSPAYPYNSLPFAFFGDFDSDDIYSSGYPVASDPPPYLMQAMRDIPAPGSLGEGVSPLSNHQASSSQPLMIELQNGRYVRVNTVAINGDASPLAFPDPAKSSAMPATPPTQPVSAMDLTPAVLVFRDGHSEEVRDYTIADGSLYARGDFYTDGFWNKKIDLASLNVAETMQANASRNVKFVLPSSPNEVITRP